MESPRYTARMAYHKLTARECLLPMQRARHSLVAYIYKHLLECNDNHRPRRNQPMCPFSTDDLWEE